MPYRVEELAERAGVSVDTVRYYQARGLLQRPRREGRVVVYDEEHLERLRRVRELKLRGLPLAFIARALGSPEGGDDPDVRLARALVEQAELEAPPVVGDGGDVDLDLDRAQVARRAGVPRTLLAALERMGLLQPDVENGAYGPSEVTALRDGRTLLDSGVPLSELLALAREYDEGVRAVADRAVDLFARHVRDPARAQTDDAEAATAQIEAVRAMLPAVGRLVSHHVRTRFLQSALERLGEHQLGDGQERAAG